MSETILLERDGDIATVVLNAPEKLNALSADSWVRLGEVMSELSADDGLRCVVIRGAGDKAFAAGADISEFETVRTDPKRATDYGKMVAKTMHAVFQCRHPSVALIKGACVGGGLEIASCCDLRIAGEGARFGIPINRLGLVVSYSEFRMLLALVGRAAALEILLEGRIWGAEEALRKGLVNRVVPDDEVEPDAMKTARRIADGAPLVARWHKKFANRMMDPAPISDADNEESYACFATEDYRIGVDAFLAKKKPEFKGR